MSPPKLILAPLNNSVNGAAIISTLISEQIEFDIKYDTSLSGIQEDVGVIKIHKIKKIIRIFCFVLSICKYSTVYFCFTPNGVAYFKDFFILIILLVKKCNITLHIHNNYGVNQSSYMLKKLLKYCKVICINEHQFEFYNKYSKARKICNTLPNLALGTNVFNYSKRVLFISNLSTKKGSMRLLKLCKMIKSSDPNINIVVCGGIIEQNKRVNIENFFLKYNVDYRGAVNEEEKKVIYSEGGVFVFLSDPYYEASPLVYIEALMFGLPVFSTKQYSFDIFNRYKEHILSAEITEKDVSNLIFTLNNKERMEYLNRESKYIFNIMFDFEKYIKAIDDFILLK